MSYPHGVKDVVKLIREDTELLLAYMSEKVALYGTLDYKFFRFYFEQLIQKLKWLEDLL